MNRFVCGCLATTALAMGLATPAGAFWLDAFADHCRRGYKQNVHWPSPHICPDRVYAHAPFDTMIRNGWRRQNLLGSHHFNEDSSQLTQAGKLKIRWIATQTPEPYRQIFVERSFEGGVTEQRMATARAFTDQIAEHATPPQLMETHIVSEGRPAGTVDYVNNQFRENMRVPMLPASTQGLSTE